MDTSAYSGFAIVFMACVVLMTFASVNSPSRLRFLAPVAVLMGGLAAYFGVGHFLGDPRPIGVAYGWSGPELCPDGAIVESAEISKAGVFITLHEATQATPRLFSFRPDPGLVDGLKRAMGRHAEDNHGEQWGFSLKCPGGVQKTSGLQQGFSLEDRPSPYTFDDPQPQVMPDKEGRSEPLVVVGNPG